MWLGDYSLLQLVSLFIKASFIENILLYYFLGMCSYLACSNKLSTANGLGLAVTIVITLSGIFNWFIYNFITKKGSLGWLLKESQEIDLSFLNVVLFIAVIASFVQILEIAIEKISITLYNSLGIYLPLITVNCAILGASLLATLRAYPFIPNCVYMLGCGLGWWLAIALIASIREKIAYSNIPKYMQGMAITFVVSGIMSLAFLAFSGINLDDTSTQKFIKHYNAFYKTR